MPQLFTFLSSSADLKDIKESGIVYKNVSPGGVEVDESGTMVHVNQIFLTDKSNPVLDKLVKKGNLIVLKSFLASKASPKKEEVPQTVAQTDPKSSVQ